jgi:hypothetical protein
MTLLTAWPLEIGESDILRGQGMDPASTHGVKPALQAAAERARMEGTCLLHPTAILREFGVRDHRHERIRLEEDGLLTGPLVARHLARSERVVAVLCTIGSELEDAVSRLLMDEPVYALALDGLGNAAVELLSQQICAHIGEQILPTNMTASTPLSPGSPEWPVEIGQPEIFRLLDAPRADIRLTSGGMMIPKKSMSFVVGIGTDMSQEGMCVICSLKDTCRYQHDR